MEYIELLHEGAGWTLPFLSAHGAAALFRVIEWLFLLTGGMTVAYMTKLFVCVFVERNADPLRQADYDQKDRYCSPVTGTVLVLSALVMPLFGMTPHATLDALADLGQGFLHGHSPAHAVAYFSWANLKGGLISLAIGAALYLLLVRRFLMVRREGAAVYADRWPKKLDLLTLLYEPVLMRYLPALLGGACRVLDFLSDGVLTLFVTRVFPALFGFICRTLEFITDGAVLLARRTTHRQSPEKAVVPAGYHLAYYGGRALNAGAALLNRTILQDRPITKNYVLVLAERQTLFRDTRRMVSASASFSLLMFGLGLAAAVVYLIFA